MSEFINKSDYPQSIHTDILDALTRDDDTVLDIIEDRDISLVKGYLEGRYDIDAIFSTAGDDRNKVILGVCLDIVIYDVFSIHNPQKLSQVRKDRYERAIEWLKAVQKGNVVINGAPKVPVQEAASDYRMMSNRKKDYGL